MYNKHLLQYFLFKLENLTRLVDLHFGQALVVGLVISRPSSKKYGGSE